MQLSSTSGFCNIFVLNINLCKLRYLPPDANILSLNHNCPFIPGKLPFTGFKRFLNSTFYYPNLIPKHGVAAASARETSSEKTAAASAIPKLMEGPTVPAEVQTPVIESLGSKTSPRFLMGDCHGLNSNYNRPIIYKSYISPIINNCIRSSSFYHSFHRRAEIVPATALMGPIPIVLQLLTS